MLCSIDNLGALLTDSSLNFQIYVLTITAHVQAWNNPEIQEKEEKVVLDKVIQSIEEHNK